MFKSLFDLTEGNFILLIRGGLLGCEDGGS